MAQSKGRTAVENIAEDIAENTAELAYFPTTLFVRRDNNSCLIAHKRRDALVDAWDTTEIAEYRLVKTMRLKLTVTEVKE